MSQALVIGASGGIGMSLVSAMRDRGISPTGIDVAGQPDLKMDVADQAEDSGWSRWLAITRDSGDLPQLIAWCVGIYDRRPAHDYDSSNTQRVLGANLSSFLSFLPVLASIQREDRKPRRLVAVSSQAAATGGTDPVYAASKAGLVAASKSLARDYARLGLTVNLVSPGPTETPMAAVMGPRRQHYIDSIPIGRFNTAEEVAAVIAWLLLDAPTAITGTVIDVDGGLVRR